jgi:hypothetical protein
MKKGGWEPPFFFQLHLSTSQSRTTLQIRRVEKKFIATKPKSLDLSQSLLGFIRLNPRLKYILIKYPPNKIDHSPNLFFNNILLSPIPLNLTP